MEFIQLAVGEHIGDKEAGTSSVAALQRQQIAWTNQIEAELLNRLQRLLASDGNLVV
ncbi:hypothetical protein D9M68_1006400 [compost metagenome]